MGCDFDPRSRSEQQGEKRDGRCSRALILLLLSVTLGACRGEGESAPDGAEEIRTGPSENTASDAPTSPGENPYAAAMERVNPGEEYAAALRATKCLIDAAPKLDQQWSVSTFNRLYKIAPTEELARRIRGLFDEAMASPITDVPERLDSPQLLEARELRPIVIELWRRKMTGAAWKKPAAALEALLIEHECLHNSSSSSTSSTALASRHGEPRRMSLGSSAHSGLTGFANDSCSTSPSCIQ
jgi:hypothetical protein